MTDMRYMFTNHVYCLSETNRWARVEKLRALVLKEGADFALICGRGIHGFGAWLTGLMNPEFPGEADGGFILPLKGNMIEVGTNALLTPEYLAAWRALDVIQPPAARVEALDSAMGFSGEQLRGLLSRGRFAVINPEVMRADLRDYLRRELPGAEWIDLTTPALRLMAIKSAEEIEVIRKVARSHDRVFAAVPTLLRPGRTEREVVVGFRRMLMDMGAAGQEIVNVMPVNLKSASQSDPEPSGLLNWPGRRLAEGDCVMLSTLSAGLSDYRVGLGRAYTLGPATESTRACWDAAVEAQMEAEAILKAGIGIRELRQTANRVLAGKGYAEDLSAFAFCIGYEIGEMGTADPEVMDVILEAGMTVVIAPSTCTDQGIRCTCMDTFLVEDHGCRRLTTTDLALRELK